MYIFYHQTQKNIFLIFYTQSRLLFHCVVSSLLSSATFAFCCMQNTDSYIAQLQKLILRASYGHVEIICNIKLDIHFMKLGHLK